MTTGDGDAVKHTTSYRRAYELAMMLHAGQVDDVGEPRLLHFERVADTLLWLFPHATEAQVEAALLHDALREGHTAEMLRDKGVSDGALAILRDLTPERPDLDYMDALQLLIDTAPLATVEVRYADNQENIRYYEANGHIQRSEWVLTHRCYPAADRLRASLAQHAKVAL